jgi:hypothetical protein
VGEETRELFREGIRKKETKGGRRTQQRTEVRRSRIRPR